MGDDGCRLELRQRIHVVAAMGEEPDSLRHLGPRSEHRAAAPGGDELAPSEAQDSRISPGAGDSTVNASGRHLGRIFDDRDAAGSGGPHDLGNVGHHPMQVRDHDGPGSGPDGLLHKRSIYGPAAGQAVDQHRPSTERQHVLKVTFEIVGGQDHLVLRPDPDSAECQLEGRRPARTEDRVFATVVPGQQFRQLGDVRAVVLSPRAVAECLLNPFGNFPVGKRPIGRPLGPERRPSQNGRLLCIPVHDSGVRRLDSVWFWLSSG